MAQGSCFFFGLLFLGQKWPKLQVVAGMNPMDLKRGIDAAVKLVLEVHLSGSEKTPAQRSVGRDWRQELEKISKPISKPSEIQQERWNNQISDP